MLRAYGKSGCSSVLSPSEWKMWKELQLRHNWLLICMVWLLYCVAYLFKVRHVLPTFFHLPHTVLSPLCTYTQGTYTTVISLACWITLINLLISYLACEGLSAFLVAIKIGWTRTTQFPVCRIIELLCFVNIFIHQISILTFLWSLIYFF